MAAERIELSPQHLAEAIVLSAAHEIAFVDALVAHPDGPQSAVEAAYVHVVAGALSTARGLATSEALSGDGLEQTSLLLRTQVHVLAGLAIRLADITGDEQPPRWQTLMNETLGIEQLNASTGEDQTAEATPDDPVAHSLAASMQAAVAVRGQTF